MNIYDSVKTRIKLICGDPVVRMLETEELDTLEIGFKLAYENYWLHYPYQRRVKRSFSNNTDIIKISFDELKSEVFAGNEFLLSKSYVLGLTRVNESDILSSTNNINSWLVGIDAIPNPMNGTDYSTKYQTLLYNASIKGAFQGTIKTEFDEILQEIRIITPTNYTATVLFDIAFGFNYDDNESSKIKCLQLVQKDTLLYFTDLVIVKFLEALISSRSAVTVTADYNISTDFLKGKLDEVKNSLKENLPLSTFTPIIYG